MTTEENKPGYILFNNGPFMGVVDALSPMATSIQDQSPKGDFIHVEELPDGWADMMIQEGKLVEASAAVLRDREEFMRRSELYTEMEACQSNLRKTDYKAIKFGEGEISEKDYGPVRQKRAAWRARINEIEARLKELNEPENRQEGSNEKV